LLFKHCTSFVSKMGFGEDAIFSTSVLPECQGYLAGKKENAYALPKRRISVRPLFAEKRPNALLLQVDVQLSRTNR
jgi:hypothetical protein